MSMCRRWGLLLLCTWAALVSPCLGDNNPGQAELDEAIDLKLTAETLPDLGQVAALCRAALRKGLDAECTPFCEKLLASTLFERGQIISDAIFSATQPDPRWPQLRRMALEDLEAALKIIPDHAQAQVIVGKLYILPGGDPAKALQAFDQAVRLAANDPNLRCEALAMRTGLHSDLAKRVADLSEIIELKPDDPAAWRMRAAVRLAQHKPEEALADFDKALELDPKHAATHEARGMTLILLKRPADARQSYDRAIELDPVPLEALSRRAQLNFAEDRFADTIGDAARILEVDRDNPLALLLRAQALLRTDHAGQALDDANRVLRHHPDLVPALRTRAMILAASGKTEAALVDMAKAVEQEPDNVEMLFQLAILHRTLKHFDEALKVLGKAIDKDADNGLLHFARADVLLSLGQHAEAVIDYEAALKSLPKDPGLLNNYAWLLATSPDDEVRDGRRAIDLATRAAELTGHKQSHILSTLAAAYAEQGDFAAARQWSQESLVVCDDDGRANLQKELASYKADKPWREKLRENPPVEQAAKPDAPKPR